VISRHWRGLAKTECADDYVAHLKGETLPALETLPGFVAASILARATPEGVEFVIITSWKSLDAIHSFAGSDAEVAVVPPVVVSMMREYDSRVRHYEVLG
jgi:heme-degrading monooxygenase HmoA